MKVKWYKPGELVFCMKLAHTKKKKKQHLTAPFLHVCPPGERSLFGT